MDTKQREALALTRDDGLKAAAIRLRAARKLAGLGQAELGAKVGKGKASISNCEHGLSFPSRAVMVYLFREHRVDFNFLIHGEFAQLPADVRDGLFETLVDAHNEWDQLSSSRSNQAVPGSSTA